MKKLLLLIGLLILLIFSSINSHAQIFATVNLMQGHMNPGLTVNLKPVKSFGLGVYGGIVHGDINYKDDFGSYYSEQTKLSAGLSYRFKSNAAIMIGVNKSEFANEANTSIIINNMDNYYYTSFEIGFYASISKYICIIGLTDPLNWESQLGVGIKFIE